MPDGKVPVDCSDSAAQGMANSQLANQKLMQDVSALGLYATIMNSVIISQQAVIDNQVNARQRMTNAAAFDNSVAFNSGTADQSGQTQNQQGQTPIAQKAADTQVQQPAGSVYPPNRNVDQASAQANAGIQAAMQALADSMANLQTSLVASITRAAGTGAAAAGSPQPAA